MKPAPFKYLRPRNLDEALLMLTDHGDDAKVLAGGQSLLPMMKLRVVRPRVLVDVFHLEELKTYRHEDGTVRIGAATTQASLLSHPDGLPGVIRSAVSSIGHLQIRNRGTVGGSLCHNDPAAEWPALSLALDVSLTLRRDTEERRVRVMDFQAGPLTTSLEPDELLTEIEIAQAPGRWGFLEVARRSGDFAMAGAIAAELADGWRVVVLVGSVPQRLHGVEEHLGAGSVLDDVAAIVREEVEVGDDQYGSSAYRLHLAAGVVDRVVKQACN